MTIPHEQELREALLKIYGLVSKDNVHGRWCERCNEDVGSGKPHKDQCLSRYILKLAEKALAAEPTPLVRLTRYDAAALELECTNRETGLLDAEKFANALQDAMIAKNGGNV